MLQACCSSQNCVLAIFLLSVFYYSCCFFLGIQLSLLFQPNDFTGTILKVRAFNSVLAFPTICFLIHFQKSKPFVGQRAKGLAYYNNKKTQFYVFKED